MAASTAIIPGAILSGLLPFPVNNDHKVLAASTAESFTVPANTTAVLISVTNLTYARVTGTATVPSADVSDGTGSFPINPTSFFSIGAGQTLSVISATANTVVSVSWYAGG